VRRFKLQATERGSQPGTAAKHHHATPTRQPATALEQFKQRHPRSICAVRQDRRACQPTEPSPNEEEAKGGSGSGANHRIKIAQGDRFSDLHEWVW
jgi:hypothetical protein